MDKIWVVFKVRVSPRKQSGHWQWFRSLGARTRRKSLQVYWQGCCRWTDEYRHHKIFVKVKGCQRPILSFVGKSIIEDNELIDPLDEDVWQLLENETVNLSLQIIPDSISANQLPNWVQGYRQTTDAYLSELAKSHKLTLLTIDKGIPGAHRILP